MPTNALHSCFDVNRAKELINEQRINGGTNAVTNFVNEKNEDGQAPIHCLMRSGSVARDVIKYLILQLEVDINAKEDNTGCTIAHICEDANIINFLITKRADFNPNIPNNANLTPIDYYIINAKSPLVTRELLKCPSLVLTDRAHAENLENSHHPRSAVSALEIGNVIDIRNAAAITVTENPTQITPAFNMNLRGAGATNIAGANVIIITPPKKHRCCIIS